jgi:phospholipase/carboxylesterase
MTTMLDGPRRAARSGKADSLVVLLHGHFANGDDLISLADILGETLPGAAFAAPNAVEQMAYPGPPAYRWFELNRRDPEEYMAGTRLAAPALDGFLDSELQRLGLLPDRLALVGFSQGTMMALHVGLRRKTAPAAIVGLAGVIAGAEKLRDEIACRPPVLLMHGSQDEVIPLGALYLTREAIAKAGVPVDCHVCDGLGHGIDDDVVDRTQAFLVRHLRADAGV